MTTDQLGRGLRDLRVSVTDRCNFRCTYCMPRELFGPDHAFLPRSELLTFEEIVAVIEAAAELGVTKIRLTGGEPLLRTDLPDLIAAIDAVPAIDDIAMTTNGVLLPAALPDLMAAGLSRVTVSLDALDADVFARMADVKVPVATVTGAVEAAVDAGLVTKINAVVQRGVNESQIVPLAEYGRQTGATVRFIEFMDVGSTNGWDLSQVVSAAEIVETIDEVHPLTAVARSGSAVANRWTYDDGVGEVGVIASVTDPFCRTCVRARLSAIGELFTCLFASSGHDLRAVLRAGESHDALVARLAAIWGVRSDRYSEIRGAHPVQPEGRVEMSYIGG
ncbi:GTP 3',8-cyclase MoaA [Euzebya tangerina]|uniref:GTP 3',8-cyclase MoaA n=1 Tax=Euzebya tangerina TaxID=591198 RepID=UPI00196A3EC1|nr:GTP 3',8-cyclase MoaA [Euzebya tangerina]